MRLHREKADRGNFVESRVEIDPTCTKQTPRTLGNVRAGNPLIRDGGNAQYDGAGETGERPKPYTIGNRRNSYPLVLAKGRTFKKNNIYIYKSKNKEETDRIGSWTRGRRRPHILILGKRRSLPGRIGMLPKSPETGQTADHGKWIVEGATERTPTNRLRGQQES